MAEKIQFDVGMDTKEFMTNSREIARAINSLKAAVTQAGKVMTSSAMGYGNAMRASIKATQEYETRIQAIKTQMETLRNSVTGMKSAAENFRTLQAAIEKSGTALSDVTRRMHEIESAAKPTEAWTNAMGQNKQAMAAAEAEMSKYKNKLDELRAIKAEMEAALGMPIGDTAEMRDLQAQIDQITPKIQQLREEQENLNQTRVTLPQEYYDLESTSQAIVREIAAMQAALNNMTLGGNATLQDFVDLRTSIQETETELNGLNQQMAEMGAQAAQAQAAQAEEMEKNQQAIAETEQQLTALQEKYESLQATKASQEEYLNENPEDKWMFEINDEQFGSIEQALQEVQSQIDATTEKLNDLQSAQEAFQQSSAEQQMPQGYEELQQRISETQQKLNDMRQALENMRIHGQEDADKTPEYDRQVREVEKLDEALEKVNETKKRALEPPYLKTWEQLPRISGMITEGLGRMQNAANLIGLVFEHPIQALDRAFGGLIVKTGQLVSSLARMAGSAALSFLRNLASTAANAAIQLARIVSNAVISGFSSLANTARNAVVSLARLATNHVASELRGMASAAINAATSLAQLAGNAIKSGLSKVGSLAASASKKLLGLDKSARRANSGLGMTFKQVLKYAFGIRSLYFLFRRLRKAVSDGLQEIAKKSPELKASLASLSKSFSALKGSLATAFAPIVTAVAPALVTLMNLLTQAINTIGAFFAALTGQKSYVKSVGKVSDEISGVGKSSKKSAKETKELENQLASFDDLNILGDSNKNATDGSSGSGSDSGLAYAVDSIGNPVKDLVEKLKELWNAGDFEGIGKLIAEKINGVFEKIDKAISWDNLGDKITKAVKAITGIFNGLIHGINWELIGKTFGDGINTIIRTLNMLIEGIDWIGLGEGIARGLNSLIDTIHWDELGELFANRINMVIWTLYGAITTFDFIKAGNALAKGINALFAKIDFEKLAITLYKAFSGVLDFIYNAVVDIEWDKIVGRIVAGFNIFIRGIRDKLVEFKDKTPEMAKSFVEGINKLVEVDWDALAEALSAAFEGALNFLYEVVDGIEWEDIITKFNAGLEKLVKNLRNFLIVFAEKADKMGEDFANIVNTIFSTVPWEDIGDLVADGINVVVRWLKSAITGIEWGDAATRFGMAIKRLIRGIEWGDIGDVINGYFKAKLDFVNAFLDYVQENNVDRELGDNISIMLGKIEWGKIATNTWAAIKKAFASAGNFIDALFSMQGDSRQMSFNKYYREEIEAFNAKPLGERIFLKLEEVFNAVPWGTMAEDVWGWIKDAFTTAGDFIQAMITAEGENGGDLATALGNRVRRLLTEEIGWSSIASTTWTVIKTAFARAGNFLDALFSQGVNADDLKSSGLKPGEYLAEVADFNAKSLGYKIGKRISEAIGAINWGDFGEILSNAVQSLFNNIRDFFIALGEVDSTGKSQLTQALEEFFGKIDWLGIAKSIIEAAWNAFKTIGEALVTAILAPFIEPIGNEMTKGATRLSQGITDAVNSALGVSDDESVQRMVETEAKRLSIEYSESLEQAFKDACATLGIGEEYADTFYRNYLEKTNENKDDMREATDAAMLFVTEGAVNEAADRGEEYVGNLFDAFKTEIMKNGHVKSEYKDSWEQIFGSVDTLESGDMQASDFMKGLQNGFTDGKVTTENKLLSIINEILTTVQQSPEGFEEKSPSKRSEQWGKDLMAGTVNGVQAEENATKQGLLGTFGNIISALSEGSESPLGQSTEWGKTLTDNLAQGAEENQESAKSRVTTVFQTISDAVSAVANGVKGFFSKMFGGNEDADTGVSAEDIAKPYEEGAARAKKALETLKSDTKTILTSVGKMYAQLTKYAKDEFDEMAKAFDASLVVMQVSTLKILDSIKAYFASTLDATKTDMATKLEAIKKTAADSTQKMKETISTKLKEIKKIFSDTLTEIRTDNNTKMDYIAAEMERAVEDMQKNVTRQINELRDSYNTNAQSIQSTSNELFNSIDSNLYEFSNAADYGSNTFDNLVYHVQDGMRDILVAVNDINDVGRMICNALSDAYDAASDISFYNIGVNIINGMIRGIKAGIPWLEKAARNAAIAAYNAAMNALDAHSPSRLFRDEVGKNMILGMIIGIEDMEPDLVDSVSNLAQAATNEMKDSKIPADFNYSVNGTVDGLDGVLTSFSDKVTDSFSNLIDKLSAISEAVTFREPAVAAGTVVPYNVSANTANASKGLVEAQETANESLISAMIQLVNNQTSALVSALQQYGGSNRGFDARSLTDSVIDEINRRTKASGRSPLLD